MHGRNGSLHSSQTTAISRRNVARRHQHRRTGEDARFLTHAPFKERVFADQRGRL